MYFFIFFLFFNFMNKDDLKVIYTDGYARFLIKGFGEVSGAEIMSNIYLKEEGKSIINDYEFEFPFTILLGKDQIAVIRYKGITLKIKGYNILRLEKDFIKDVLVGKNKVIIKMSSDFLFKEKNISHQNNCKEYEKNIFLLRFYTEEAEYYDFFTTKPKKVIDLEKADKVEVFKVLCYDDFFIYVSKIDKI